MVPSRAWRKRGTGTDVIWMHPNEMPESMSGVPRFDSTAFLVRVSEESKMSSDMTSTVVVNPSVAVADGPSIPNFEKEKTLVLLNYRATKRFDKIAADDSFRLRMDHR